MPKALLDDIKNWYNEVRLLMREKTVIETY